LVQRLVNAGLLTGIKDAGNLLSGKFASGKPPKGRKVVLPLSEVKGAKPTRLQFGFEGDVEFRVFNFTRYEVWEIHFSNGTGEYSNCAK
jgi:hypothetical protein